MKTLASRTDTGKEKLFFIVFGFWGDSAQLGPGSWAGSGSGTACLGSDHKPEPTWAWVLGKAQPLQLNSFLICQRGGRVEPPSSSVPSQIISGSLGGAEPPAEKNKGAATPS